jgi:hypothetical protein
MKKGRNRGWTLMDADIPVARHRFLSIRVYLRPSAVRIFEADFGEKGWRDRDVGSCRIVVRPQRLVPTLY